MPFCPLKKYKNFFSISAFSSPAVTFLPFIYSPSLLTANRSHHPAAVSNQKKMATDNQASDLYIKSFTAHCFYLCFYNVS